MKLFKLILKFIGGGNMYKDSEETLNTEEQLVYKQSEHKVIVVITWCR